MALTAEEVTPCPICGSAPECFKNFVRCMTRGCPIKSIVFVETRWQESFSNKQMKERDAELARISVELATVQSEKVMLETELETAKEVVKRETEITNITVKKLMDECIRMERLILITKSKTCACGNVAAA